jgi:hypothetical protein
MGMPTIAESAFDPDWKALSAMSRVLTFPFRVHLFTGNHKLSRFKRNGFQQIKQNISTFYFLFN